MTLLTQMKLTDAMWVRALNRGDWEAAIVFEAEYEHICVEYDNANGIASNVYFDLRRGYL